MKFRDLPARMGRNVIGSLDPLSKLAQVAAVVIAGIWTYHLHEITGEGDINAEVWLSTDTFAYSKDSRLLVVHIREKNVGKVHAILDARALSLAIKKLPDEQKIGYVDMAKVTALFEEKGMLKRYGDGVDLSPGVEFQDVAEFVISPGLYHIEANLELPDGDFISDIVVVRID